MIVINLPGLWVEIDRQRRTFHIKVNGLWLATPILLVALWVAN